MIKRRSRLAALVCLLLLAWALRVHALGAKSLWYDELRQVEVAQRPLAQMGPHLIVHAARPLDYVLTHYWLRGLGPVDPANTRAEFWLRFPAALFSLLSVAALWPLARRWMRAATRGPAALAATALLAAAPLGVAYGQELRPYALYLLLSVLSFYFLDRALRSGPPRLPAWLAFALVSALGGLTHFFFAAVVLVQGVFLAARAVALGLRLGRRGWWPAARDLGGYGLGALLGLAALFVSARPEHLVLFARQFAAALAAAPVTGLVSDRGALVGWGAVVNTDLLLTGWLPFLGGGGGAALIPFLALGALGLAALARQSAGRFWLALLWLLLAPALVLIYLGFRQEFFALRYILFVLPIYLLLAAGGLAALAAAAGRRQPGWGTAVMLSGAALLAALQVAQAVEHYRAPKDDWRRLGAFLLANVRRGDTLGAPDVQALVRFYAPGLPAVVVDANELGPHEQALANGERFWFVWSEYTLLPVDETRAWALSLPSVTLELDPRLRVVFVHPGRTVAEMLAEAETFAIPPPSLP